jgi:pimeloyl-ACP methyl ester carboxylesterase
MGQIMRVTRAVAMALLAAAAVLGGRAEAQEKFGVILMHGKDSSATDNRSGLPVIASQLQGQGHKVVTPSMPWASGGWENINLTVRQVYDIIDGYAAQLRSQGVQRIVIGGHSLGANIALSYAVNRGNVAGVVMAGPGHSPGYVYRFNEAGKTAIEHANELVRSGKGSERIIGIDDNQGTSLKINTTAAVYVSWLSPRGLASMDAQAPKLPASIPLLLVIGEKDPAFSRAKTAYYDPAAKNPYSKYVVVGANHAQTPFAASKQIVDWINGLPR